MGIKLPEELADVAQRAGVHWPEADEDHMRSLAEAWRAAAAEVRDSRTDAHSFVQGAFESYEGDAADAAREHWELFVADEGRFASIVRGCEEAAGQLEFAADQIAATKVEIVRRLVKLAVRKDAAEQAVADGDASAQAELDSLFAGAKAEFAEVNETLTAAVEVEAGEALPDVDTDTGDLSPFQPVGATAGELLDPDLAALLGIDADAVLPELGDQDGDGTDDLGEDDQFDDAAPLVLSELVNSMVESGDLSDTEATELAENRGFTWGDDLVEQQELEAGGPSPSDLRDLDPESTGPIPAGVVDQAVRAADSSASEPGGGAPAYSPLAYTPDPSMNTGPINIPAGAGSPSGSAGGSGGGGSAAPAPPSLTPSFSGPPSDAAPAPAPRPEPAPSAPPAQNIPSAPAPQPPAGSPGGGQAPAPGGAGQPQAPGRPMPVLPGPGAPGGIGLPGGSPVPGMPGAPVAPGVPGAGAPGAGSPGVAAPGAGAPGAAAPGGGAPAPAPKLPAAGGGLPGLGAAPAPFGAPAPGAPGLAAGPGVGAAPGFGGAQAGGGGAVVAHLAGGGPVAGKAMGPIAQAGDLFGGGPVDQNAAGRPVRPTTPPDAELLAFTMNLFPLGHLPVPSTRPARQLPAPPRETDFAPGIRFPPQDHPQSELVDLRDTSAARPQHAPEDQQGACPRALVSGHDPLGDVHERAWDRRFLVRAAETGHAAPAEYAWPPGELFPEGAADPAGSEPVVLAAGTALDRFGTPEGRVLAEADTRFAARSLPPEYADRPYARYVVQRPLPAWRAVSAPWFAQPGGGLRFRLTQSVVELLRAGYLVVDEDAPAARVSATVSDVAQTVPQA
ncbi:TNT domain-containing protein [Actinoalloteichus fjordicus]|uniref:DUF4237 family protein n=1 Tax=Actinoalloteichus fjordicus TaxID=1612552 RepID=A0AAC9LI90_9PSEU|nr:TNT domain-containing protein [Actinoalloteichus fjordicus]APU17370.1 putative DUF4237 family protein [Actinoalloteichus fjordicus]